jgi:hypothetical protein
MNGSIRWLVMVALAVLVGCQNAPRRFDNDPLMGGGATSGVSPRRSADTGLVKDEVPPPPPPSTTTSPAALTSGAIHANEDRRTPGVGVRLHGPRSPEIRPVTTGPVSEPIATVSGSYERLQQELKTRGVTWQQLRVVEGDLWHFMCAIPDPQNANLLHNFEVRAVGPHGLAAIRAALDKIDRERR